MAFISYSSIIRCILHGGSYNETSYKSTTGSDIYGAWWIRNDVDELLSSHRSFEGSV